MENSFQTSFIPKKPILAGNTPTSTTSSTTSITMVVTVFIFIVMLAGAAGLYVYKNYYLIKNKEELSANLSKIRGSFEKDTIAELELYDNRTGVAKDILSSHIVLSPLFEAINGVTLTTIQFNKFEHTTGKDVFSVRMSGIARDYKSIALQADIFNSPKGKMFKDVIFSNLTKDKNNYVTFDLEFNVDPQLLSYEENISNSKVKVESNSAINNTPTAPAPSAVVTPDISTTTTNAVDTNKVNNVVNQKVVPVPNNTQ